ncbi:MAG: hypothetical protein ABIU54_07580, partial [Candidatus Eisenbacteria bacterium]
MSPLTAIILMISSLALLLLDPLQPRTAWRRVGLGLAMLASWLGLMRVGASASLWSFRLDRVFLPAQPRGGPSGLMAGTTGVCCLLIGLGLMSLATRPGRFAMLRQSVLIVVIAIAMAALLGYAYGAVAIHGQMAFVTALLLAGLSIAVLWATQHEGIPAALRQSGPAGAMVRRILLPVVLLPVVLGWLHLVGQRLGRFDDAEGTAAAV